MRVVVVEQGGVWLSLTVRVNDSVPGERQLYNDALAAGFVKFEAGAQA